MINKKLISLAVVTAMVTPVTAYAKPEITWLGYAQLTAEALDEKKPTNQDSFVFGVDRARLGFKITDKNVFGNLQIDVNKDGKDENGFMELIKDAEAGYKYGSTDYIKIGQFKTPVGMDFNTPENKLDITKLGMDSKLVLERSQGIMMSGRNSNGGVGYDIFYGNATPRSAAVTGNPDSVGRDKATAFRIMFDSGENFHIEISTGKSENAAGTINSASYSVNDLAFNFKTNTFTVKAEYIEGKDVLGISDRDEEVYFVHLGYTISKTYEVLGRYYKASADAYGTTVKSDLSNLYLGINLFLGSTKTNGRLQLNYVIADGDTIGTSNEFSGVSTGYMDDAILLQYQVSI
ncbi:MAG: porin [Thiohalomonadales bacterium]